MSGRDAGRAQYTVEGIPVRSHGAMMDAGTASRAVRVATRLRWCGRFASVHSGRPSHFWLLWPVWNFAPVGCRGKRSHRHDGDGRKPNARPGESWMKSDGFVVTTLTHCIEP